MSAPYGEWGLKCGLHLRHWPELSLIKIRGLILSAASTQHPRIQGKPKYCKEVLDAKYQHTILKILLLALLLRGKQDKPPTVLKSAGYDRSAERSTLIRNMKNPFNHRPRLVPYARQKGMKATARSF